MIVGLYSRNKLNLFFQNHRNEKIVRRYILVWFWDLFKDHFGYPKYLIKKKSDLLFKTKEEIRKEKKIK